MTGFYRPPLDGLEEDPFARDGEDKLIRRGYWLGLSDRSLVLLMTKGIGTRLTADGKRAHLTDIRRARLIDAILMPEILPPERGSWRIFGKGGIASFETAARAASRYV